ncbi:hypothetical protein AX16_003070 [Volvariella volvacea WC 439]|nr:hypothetical protein AX16_003070 [Volvariella volvacea WC 439]
MFSFDHERRRAINLGGASSASSSTDVLGQAKADRLGRLEQKRRQESATRIQAWWRGVHQARLMRNELRKTFASDVTGLTGLRCLVLIGQDEAVLAQWSSALVELGEAALFAPASGPHQESWFVLIRKACLLLLQSVANAPRSSAASQHLWILNAFLSPEVSSKHLGPGSNFTQQILSYLINRQYYSPLSRALNAIPPEAKSTSPSLPLIVPLTYYPLTAFASSSQQYSTCVHSLFSDILTIPLLPNRLPISSLTRFSASLPLASMQVMAPHLQSFSQLSSDSKAHLIANLLVFVVPRYSSLTSHSVTAYLQLLTTLLNSLPPHSLEPLHENGTNNQDSTWTNISDPDEDEDSSKIRVRVVSSFNNQPSAPPPLLDTKTLKRLAQLPAPSHIKSLWAVSQRQSLEAFVAFTLALNTIWPGTQDAVLSTVLINSKGGIVRELYRVYVRASPMGKDEHPGAIMDPANASYWPPLLLLCDLYTQMLLTMDDGEFFSRGGMGVTTRNPLSLDELTVFSRRLLNIAFALYWREDQISLQEGGPGIGKGGTGTNASVVKCSWESVRDRVTKCLLGIHARDSRAPFAPADHWLVSSQFDLRSFIDAAVLEQQQLATDTSLSQVLSKRQLASISPRLGVLNNIPFAIPFESRVNIYRYFIMSDMKQRGRNQRFWGTYRNRIQIRRGHVAQDGYDRLAAVDLKDSIEITFIDQWGQPEAGIDGGGVFKEFFTSLCKEVFDTDRGLWLANKKNELYPNPHAYATESHSLSWYRFIGRILGKAMYEGILVDVAFAGFFLAKWLGKQSLLDDLASLDPDLYKGLIYLKHYAGDPEDLSLNFTIAIEEFGVTKTIDLKPNGSNIPVTRENRSEYILRVSHYRLSKQIRKQSEAFFEGLMEMIDVKWIRMFNQQELQMVLGGTDSEIDLDDLRKHTNYGGVYDDKEETIVTFWKVVNSFTQDQRRALLRFVTSCSRPPLLGFRELIPNFSIRDSGDEQRLPSSSTCVNLLKLPRYKSEKLLREKLLKAIYSNAGFDLS